MAPRIKRSANVSEALDRLTNQLLKKRTFINRIKYEKCLPLKKRMFPVEFLKVVARPVFKPTPYEKPITRSRGRRSIESNKASDDDKSNKENKVILTDNEKVRI